MPSELDPSVLVDGLVGDVIDGLREDLHPQFGVRPYRLFTVRRVWSGRTVGEGRATDYETEIRPQPRVRPEMIRSLEDGGVRESGAVVVTEVSLALSFADLTGGTLQPNEQWLFRLDEGKGQGQPPRWFILDAPPAVDVDEAMGWRMRLRRAT